MFMGVGTWEILLLKKKRKIVPAGSLSAEKSFSDQSLDLGTLFHRNSTSETFVWTRSLPTSTKSHTVWLSRETRAALALVSSASTQMTSTQ